MVLRRGFVFAPMSATAVALEFRTVVQERRANLRRLSRLI
jgi:hypothetical protein